MSFRKNNLVSSKLQCKIQVLCVSPNVKHQRQWQSSSQTRALHKSVNQSRVQSLNKRMVLQPIYLQLLPGLGPTQIRWELNPRASRSHPHLPSCTFPWRFKLLGEEKCFPHPSRVHLGENTWAVSQSGCTGNPHRGTHVLFSCLNSLIPQSTTHKKEIQGLEIAQ